MGEKMRTVDESELVRLEGQRSLSQPWILGFSSSSSSYSSSQASLIFRLSCIYPELKWDPWLHTELLMQWTWNWCWNPLRTSTEGFVDFPPQQLVLLAAAFELGKNHWPQKVGTQLVKTCENRQFGWSICPPTQTQISKISGSCLSHHCSGFSGGFGVWWARHSEFRVPWSPLSWWKSPGWWVLSWVSSFWAVPLPDFGEPPRLCWLQNDGATSLSAEDW